VSNPETLILKEAADLHRFLQPIAKMCAIARTDHPYYRDASYILFTYLSGLINKTREYLEDLPQRPGKSPVIQHSIRQKLKLLRDSWGLLHRYIKPCLDADTLHIPIPLLDVLNDRLKLIPECEAFECAVFQLTAANYAMLPYYEVNSVANGIARRVNGEDFPRSLSLVGIPYSQSSGFFLNCLIPHEMAHFVYQEIMVTEVTNAVDSILNTHYPNAQDASDEFLETLSQIRGLINLWVEEIFCDLFAIALIGPAFSFAFAEMTSASLIIDTLSGNAKQSFEFGQSHPADVARFYLHKRHLDALGWWNQIKDWRSNSVDLLDHCCLVFGKTTLSNKIPPDVASQLKLQCFWDACDWLLGYVKRTVPASDKDIKHLADHYDVISKYLERAIVPSTIITESGPVYPTPVVLINSAFRFVLQDFDNLLKRVDMEPMNPVRERSWYTERLELWVLKALEDYRLLSASQEAK